MQPTLLHPLKTPPSTIRFGEAWDGFLGPLPSEKPAADGQKPAEADQFKLLMPGENQPPSRVAQGRQKIKTGFMLLMAMIAGLGVGWLGNVSRGNYEAAKPDKEVVRLERELHADWVAARDQAIAASRGGALSNPAEQARLRNATQGLLYRLYFTMKENPGGESTVQLDRFLTQMLARRDNFMPDVVGSQIADEFTNEIWRVMEREQGVQNAQTGATVTQIDRAVPAMERFIARHPQLRHLDAGQRQTLVQEVKEIYIQQRSFISPSHFNAAFSGALGTGIAGITYQDMATVTNRQGAIDFFRKVVQNDDNFRGMSPEVRQAFLERGTEVLSTLEYTSPSILWGASAWLMLLFGFGLAAGVLGKDMLGDRKLFGVITGALDVREGMKNPALVIRFADRKDPDVQRNYDQMTASMKLMAGEVERIMRSTYDTDAHAKEVLDSEFGGKDKLPTAEHIIAKAFVITRQTVLAGMSTQDKINEKPVDELAFLQEMKKVMETALETGSFLSLGLPEGMKRPQKPDVEKAKTPVEALRLQRELIEFEMREGRLMLANRVFGYAESKEKLDGGVKRLRELEDAMLAEGDKPESKERSTALVELKRQVDEQEAVNEAAQRKFSHQQQQMEVAKALLGEKIAEMREFHRQLSAAIERDAATKTNAELLALQKQAEAVINDPDLAEAIRESELQRHIDAAAKADSDAMAKAKALIAEQLKRAQSANA